MDTPSLAYALLMRSHRYAVLFVSLLLTVALGPLAGGGGLRAYGRWRSSRGQPDRGRACRSGCATQRRVLWALIAIALVLRWLSEPESFAPRSP